MKNITAPQTFAPIQFIDASELGSNAFVRAIASSLDSKYDEVLKTLTELGMPAATTPDVVKLIMNQLTNKKEPLSGHLVVAVTDITNTYSNGGKEVIRKMTLGSFLKAKKEGTFIVGLSRAIVVIKDGIIHGTVEECAMVKARVECAFQLTSATPAISKKK